MESVLKKNPFSRSLIVLLVWFTFVLWNFKYLGKLHSFSEILNATQHLDVGWYKKIAVDGYSIDPAIVDGQTTVFFPLFPLISSFFIHVLTIEPLLALNIVQKICLIGMSYLVYRWLKDLQLPAGEGLLSVLLHPALVFLIVPYTESLYLCCLFGLLIAWHRKNSVAIFLSAFLLSLCRPTGLFVLPAAALTLFFYFLSVYRIKNTRIKPSLVSIKNVVADEEFKEAAKLLIFASTGAIIALVVIAVVMHISVGDWYAFYRYRSLWNEKPGFINFVGFLNLDYGYRFPSILVTWFSIAGSIILALRGFLFEGILCLLSILLPAYQGKMGDIIRYSLGAAPAWVMLYMSLGRHRLLQMGLIGFSISVAMLMIDAWIRRVWVG